MARGLGPIKWLGGGRNKIIGPRGGEGGPYLTLIIVGVGVGVGAGALK